MATKDTVIPIAWRVTNIPLTKILTRNFCLPKELPHYDFCRAYFEERTTEALNECAYTKWLPRQHTDYFIHYPPDLQRAPIWWELPWGGFNKINENIDKKKSLESRLQSCRDYLILLNSIQNNGFNFNKGPLTPVHLLICEDNYVVIQHGSTITHLQYLINNNHMNLVEDISFDKDGVPLVPCSVNLVVDRDDLRQMETVGSKLSQFLLEDAYKWFDLCFDLINHKSDEHQRHSSNQILEALESLVN